MLVLLRFINSAEASAQSVYQCIFIDFLLLCLAESIDKNSLPIMLARTAPLVLLAVFIDGHFLSSPSERQFLVVAQLLEMRLGLILLGYIRRGGLCARC
jgi:hypothetical protein